jgi:phosphatidylinositol-3-phosphatase
MKRLFFILCTILLCSCEKEDSNTSNGVNAPSYPDHIIFVWFENKSYSQIVNSTSAPYINSLIPEGTLFTNFYALAHPSYPEYIHFFAGTDNGKKDNLCINNQPYSNPNLYTELTAEGKTFAWYSEDLPFTGSDTCSAYPYVERHNPVTCFSNIPGSANKRWADFPNDYKLLENVVCITPNLLNDMHDGSIGRGDTWLKNNLSLLIEWCKTNNSVFVVHFDEDNGAENNHIAVIAIGEKIKDNYKSDIHYNHYNWTKTILQKYGADPIANSVNVQTIDDCWK